jgi:hypothetical protein
MRGAIFSNSSRGASRSTDTKARAPGAIHTGAGRLQREGEARARLGAAFPQLAHGFRCCLFEARPRRWAAARAGRRIRVGLRSASPPSRSAPWPERRCGRRPTRPRARRRKAADPRARGLPGPSRGERARRVDHADVACAPDLPRGDRQRGRHRRPATVARTPAVGRDRGEATPTNGRRRIRRLRPPRTVRSCRP